MFDRAGKMDFFQWQIALTRLRIKDGDSLSVLSETENKTARIIFYESHQIDSGKSKTAQDGVFLDKFGRHIAYNLVDVSNPDVSSSVAASDAIFYADFERPGQVRGISALAHALNNIQDSAEITADVLTNILLPGLDHREVAYHWRAFRAQFRFIAGREPVTLTVPLPKVVALGV